MGSYIPSSGSTVYTCKDDINRSFYDPINDEAINLCRWVGQNLSYRCELDCPCAKDIKKKNKYLCPITCSLCVDSPSTSPSEKQSSNPSTYSCEDDVDHSFYDPVKDIAINLCLWVGQDSLHRCELECPCKEEQKKENKYLCLETCNMCADSPSTSPSNIPSPAYPEYDCKDDEYSSFYDPINDDVINLCSWVGQDSSYRCELECPCKEGQKKKNKYICLETCNMCSDSPSTSASNDPSSAPTVYECKDDTDSSFYDPINDTIINLCVWVGQDSSYRC